MFAQCTFFTIRGPPSAVEIQKVEIGFDVSRELCMPGLPAQCAPIGGSLRESQTASESVRGRHDARKGRGDGKVRYL